MGTSRSTSGKGVYWGGGDSVLEVAVSFIIGRFTLTFIIEQLIIGRYF